jgi:hypothetical protein
MQNLITFTDTFGIEEEYHPKPAFNYLPEWYQKQQSYMNNKKEIFTEGAGSQTIKKCMPVFDALTAGYIIPTYGDVYVRQESGVLDGKEVKAPYFSWSNFKSIEIHSEAQVNNYPKSTGFGAPKWLNPWSIKVPKGYSVLFLPPMHNSNKIFEVMEGIVDCDEYIAPVNFPFYLLNTEFEGLIPAGTPLVQVIPFKRDGWQMTKGTNKDLANSASINNKLKTKFFDSYKNLFRTAKEYK